MKFSLEERIAGILIPVFALRSADDLGIGDAGSLRRFRRPMTLCQNNGSNASATLSDGAVTLDDGRFLAFISRVNGQFKLHVMDLASGATNAITDTTADEKPSFAPNSKLIVYATQLGGKEALMTTTLDGKIKARLAGQAGDIREPDWGPFQKQ